MWYSISHRMSISFGFIFIFAFSTVASAEIKSAEFVYEEGETTMRGYIAYDESSKSARPGVLVVHDWWGHGDFVRGQARALAQLGYTALAVDLYGDGRQAPDTKVAGELAYGLIGNPEVLHARFQAALDALRSQGTVHKSCVAAVGYSLGGFTVLNAARQGTDLAGVVSYYGKLVTKQPAGKGSVKAKILVLHPVDDDVFPVAQTNIFKEEMDAAEAEYKIVTYPGAKHLFARPDADAIGKKFNQNVAYDEKADKKAWTELQAFLKNILSSC